MTGFSLGFSLLVRVRRRVFVVDWRLTATGTFVLQKVVDEIVDVVIDDCYIKVIYMATSFSITLFPFIFEPVGKWHSMRVFGLESIVRSKGQMPRI